MSYDPHRYPRHRAPAPYAAPADGSGPPWAAQTYQEQPGYADTFDGAQGHAGAQSYAGYDSYPAQAGQADPFAGYNGYGAAPGGGYADMANGYAELNDGFGAQDGYIDAQDGYVNPPEYGVQGGYQDVRSSGPMLAAPDETRWDGFGGDVADQRDAGQAPGVLAGGVMGFVAAGAAIGIATFAAAFFRPQASPIIAVGEWFIDHTPPWLKNFAVEKFGEHDKTMLLLGMYVTIAFLAIGIGVLARRRTMIGVVGVAVFGLFGAYIAYTRPDSRFSDIIPSIIGGIAGVAALLLLASAASDEPARSVRQSRQGHQGRQARHGSPRTAGGWS